MEPEIVAAVRAGDAPRVEALLEGDPGLAGTRVGGNSLLLFAVYGGQTGIAALIQARRDDLDIFEAAAVGDVARLGVLLDREPGLWAAFSADGFTPLALAGFFGQTAAVTALLDRGADIDAIGRSTAANVPQNTALHAALAGQAWDAVRVLLDRGADVTVRDSGGRTALHGAAFGAPAAVVEAICRAGADVNARDGEGMTALGRATARGNTAAADVLRGRGGVL